MEKQVDQLTVTMGLDTKGLKAGAKEAKKALDQVEQKAKKTGEVLSEALTGEKSSKDPSKSKTSKKNPLYIFTKNVVHATHNVDKLHTSIKSLGSGILKMVGETSPALAAGIGLPFAALIAAFKVAGGVRSVANANTPYNFLTQQLNTSIPNLSAAGQAIGLTGGKSTNILQALGGISTAQTQTRIFGTSAINPYLNMLGVPLAKDGVARKPLDVLLDISHSLKKNIADKRLTKQDAYNILGAMGFSTDVANFLMQGRSKVLQQLESEKKIGVLSKTQAAEFLKVTAASAQMSNAFTNLERVIAFKLSPATIAFYNILTKIIGAAPKEVGGAVSVYKQVGQGIYGEGRKALDWIEGKKGIRALTRHNESDNNYNAYNTGTNAMGVIGHSGSNSNLSNMTIGQVLGLMASTKGLSSKNPNRLFAAGAYQFTPNTLKAVAAKAGISLNSKFDKATQDKLANYLFMQDAGNYITGKTLDPSNSLARLRRDWTSGQHISNAQMISALNYSRKQYQLQEKSGVTHHTVIQNMTVTTQAKNANELTGAFQDHIARIPTMTNITTGMS